MPVTVTHAKSNSIADFTGTVTVNNSSGGTVSAAATDLVRPSDWNSAHVVSLQLTGSEIASLFSFGNGLTSSSDAGGITVGHEEEEIFEPFMMAATGSTTHAPGIGTWYFDPFYLPYSIESGLIRTPVTHVTNPWLNGAVISQAASSQGGAVTITQAFYHNLALYTQGNGNDITRLGTYWTGQMSLGMTQVKSVGAATLATSNAQVSNYFTLQVPGQWDVSGNITYSTITTSGTLSAGATSIAASSIDSLIANVVTSYIGGSRMDVIPMGTTLAPGMYVMAHQFFSSSGTTSSFSATGGGNYAAGTYISTHARPMLLELNMGAYKQLGKGVSNSSSQPMPWHGIHATSQSSAWSTVATTDLRATNVRMYWNRREEALT